MHERFRNAVDCFYIVSCDSEWTTVAFYSMFFNTHQSGVLTALFAYYMAGTTWNCCYHSAHSVCTIQPCTSLHCYFKWSHIGKVHTCLPEWMGPFICYCSNTGWSRYQNRNHVWEHFFQGRKKIWTNLYTRMHHLEEHYCFESGTRSYIPMKNIIVSNQEEAVTSPWRTSLFQIRKRQLHHYEEHHCFKSGRGSLLLWPLPVASTSLYKGIQTLPIPCQTVLFGIRKRQFTSQTIPFTS